MQICPDQIAVGYGGVVAIDGNPLHLCIRVPRHRPPNRVLSCSDLYNGSNSPEIPGCTRDLNPIGINLPKANLLDIDRVDVTVH
jgi:hypothetical protein